MESVPSYGESALTAFPPIGCAELSKLEACLLDALPACVALVDHRGTVVFVNRAWSRFAEENGGLGHRDVVGTSCLDPGFWTTNIDEPPDDVARACAGVRAVLGGNIAGFTFSYPCHTPSHEHWLELRVNPLPLEEGDGALIMQIDISERKRSADRAWQRANHDGLTDLPNRSLLLDRLAQALALARRHGGEGALLCIDVEHLDHINESLGHDAGDEVLRHLARSLRASVRQSDSAARIGEDEFAVLVPRLGDGAAIEALTEKLIRALSGEIELGGQEVALRVTVGAVCFPSAEETAEQILKAARATVRRIRAAHWRHR